MSSDVAWLGLSIEIRHINVHLNLVLYKKLLDIISTIVIVVDMIRKLFCYINKSTKI